MKLGGRLWLVLGGIVVVLLIAAGVFYTSNSGQVSKHAQLQTDISRAQVTLNQSSEEKSTLASQTPQLEALLAEAKSSLANISFLPSSESIEYDTMLFSIADGYTLHVTNLSASTPEDREENKIKYQSTTFTINVEGVFPDALPQAGADSKQYIASTVDNILAFVNTIVINDAFNTTIINSVSINVPEPLTDAEVVGLYTTLQDEIKGKLTDEEKKDKTDFEIGQLVWDKLLAMTPEEIKLFLEKQGFERPSAIITFEIWTYKVE